MTQANRKLKKKNRQVPIKLRPEFKRHSVAASLAGKTTKYSKGTFNDDGPDPFLTNETQRSMNLKKQTSTNNLNFPSDSQCRSESLYKALTHKLLLLHPSSESNRKTTLVQENNRVCE